MGNDNPLRRERDAVLVALGDHRIELAYDPDGDLWYVRSSNVPGLVATAASEQDLRDDLPFLVSQVSMP